MEAGVKAPVKAPTMDVPDDITIPPPAIKGIVHKTVQYIHRNGPEFEQKVRESNSKFTFLKDTDPFHAYYRYALEHLPREDAENGSSDTALSVAAVEPVDELKFFVKDQPTMTVKDLEIVKLAAQYVAQHGDESTKIIEERYSNEPLLFGFMSHGHKWFQWFRSLVKQYRSVIDSDYAILSVKQMLERAQKRATFEESIKQEEHSRKQIEEAKRLRFASVNWTDFVIVETIQFEHVDMVAELALPVTIEELQLRSLDAKSKQLTTPAPLAGGKAPPAGMNIREFGTTRLKQTPKSTSDKLIQCPLSGKMIPENNFERHIQILLRDPKYAEEKKRYEDKSKNTNWNTEEVVTNFKNLFKPSPTTTSENDANKRQKVLWDGYQSSKEFVKEQNRATKDEYDEYKRKQREPEIGPKRH